YLSHDPLATHRHSTAPHTLIIDALPPNTYTLSLHDALPILNVAGGTSTGNFQIASGKTLQFNADYTLNAGTTFTGAGTAQLQGEIGRAHACTAVTSGHRMLSAARITRPGTYRVGNGKQFTWN